MSSIHQEQKVLFAAQSISRQITLTQFVTDFNKNKSKALNHLAKVLEDGVRKGFRPIIVLDNFEAIESLLLQPGGSTKALINKLLEMANQGIANVVVTINLPTSMMYLDSSTCYSVSA